MTELRRGRKGRSMNSEKSYPSTMLASSVNSMSMNTRRTKPGTIKPIFSFLPLFRQCVQTVHQERGNPHEAPLHSPKDLKVLIAGETTRRNQSLMMV